LGQGCSIPGAVDVDVVDVIAAQPIKKRRVLLEALPHDLYQRAVIHENEARC
jgi:hypothetical protein